MAKQTTITIETTSLLILRSGPSHRAWCPQCGAEGEMLALGDIRLLSNVDPLAFERWLDSTDVHHSEATDGTVRICLSSLLARVRNTTGSHRDIPRWPNPNPERKRR